jgi:hypothetical protein
MTIVASPLIALLSILPLFAVPPAAVAPKAKDPSAPLQMFEDEASCATTTTQAAKDQTTVLVRNTCPLRINFALCIHRPEDREALVTKGSLSPAAVYDQVVTFKGKGREFKQATNFCPGVTCEVAEPTC